MASRPAQPAKSTAKASVKQTGFLIVDKTTTLNRFFIIRFSFHFKKTIVAGQDCTRQGVFPLREVQSESEENTPVCSSFKYEGHVTKTCQQTDHCDAN
ncbi:hypothetical protein ES703_123607 [subsurface metagenome]